MHCPFYLVVGTIRTSSGVFYVYTEVNSTEVDIEDKKTLLEELCRANKCENGDIAGMLLIANSTEGGPKVVGDWIR